MVENQTCTNFCGINDFYKKRCISNYQDKETNADLILNIILNELSSNSFNISIFDKNENITINENNVSFALINLKNKNIVNINSDLSLCINELKKYYDIYEDKNVIVLKIEVENKVKYELFSQLKGIKLERLDLNKCNNYYNFYNIKCDMYSINSIINDLCISCQKDYYEMYNDTTNIYPYINCYTFLEGYYLYNNKYFKRCFYSCLSCEKEGDNEKHSCGSCKESYPFEINFNSDKNCYKKCQYYHYLNNNVTYCTIKDECNKDFDKLILDKKECVKKCSDDKEYKYEFRKQCFKKCPNYTEPSKEKEFYCEVICNINMPFERIETQECVEQCSLDEINLNSCKRKYFGNETDSNIKVINKKLESIEKDLTGDNFNSSDLDDGNVINIKDENFTVIIRATKSLDSDEDANYTIIDLGPCEKLIKDYYKMKESDLIYTKQIEVSIKGMKIPKIEFDVFAKINGNNLVKLNLSICFKEKVDFLIKLEIDEDLNKLNISSPYYTDICFIDESKDGVYVSLKDRKVDYVENNKAVCQEDCNLKEYDNIKQKVKCSCPIKESSKSFSDININKTKLYENFVNVKNYVNFGILVCYRELFTKKGIIHNIGCYIIIPLFIFYFVCIIIFYNKEFSIIKESIKDIAFGIRNYNLIKEKEKPKITSTNRKKININKENKKKNINILNTGVNKRKNNNCLTIKENNQKEKENEFINKNRRSQPFFPLFFNMNSKRKNLKRKSNFNTPPIKNLANNKIKINKNENMNNDKKEATSVSKRPLNHNSTIFIKMETKQKVNKIMKLNDEELNTLPYEEALKLDERTFCEYYLSLLKTKHIFIFAFCLKNDYNSRIIKIYLFIFSLFYYIFFCKRFIFQ